MSNPEQSTFIKVLSQTADKTVELAKQSPVIGEKIVVDGMTIIPVSKVSVGFAGGGSDISDGAKKSKNPSGSGAKISVTPMSFLVVDGKSIRTVKIDADEKSPVSEVIGSVVAKIKAQNDKKKADKKAEKKALKLEKKKK